MKQFFYHITISAILLILTAVFLPSIGEVKTVPLSRELIQLPYRLGAWEGIDARMDDSVLAVLGVEDHLMRRYSARDGSDIWIYVGYYESQKEDDIIHSPKNCLLGNGWEPVSSSRERIELTDGPAKTVEVSRYLVQKGQKKDLVVYFYYSGKRVVSNDYLYRLGLLRDIIFTKRSNGAFVKVSCSVTTDEIHAWQNLAGFLQKFIPVLNEHLNISST